VRIECHRRRSREGTTVDQAATIALHRWSNDTPDSAL
jgi:hypothetical protein